MSRSNSAVVAFARWEEWLIVAPGNLESIRSIEDLGQKAVRLINGEAGSGGRALLDRLLEKAGIHAGSVQGYDRAAYGHLAAALCVLSGRADVCLATRFGSNNVRGRDFIPVHGERCDLVMWRRTSELPAVQAFLDVLRRRCAESCNCSPGTILRKRERSFADRE